MDRILFVVMLVLGAALSSGCSPGEPLDLSPSRIDQTFHDLVENEDFSGVVYLKKDGSEIIRAAFGLANRATNEPVRLDTIFGIGSRPIDFTTAGVYLLASRQELSPDDPITSYFDDVPEDKRAITIRHLLTGRSGLRDFHGSPADWDQDLAWISREEAERRILDQKLLFEPGTDRASSHSAFGLLASVIERVSGEDYFDFLKRNFFDPAGMTRTGEYGSFGGHDVRDFAVGGGPEIVGEPNIPPNWGKTSWLVKGSGGMYSTLDDLLRFLDFVRTSGVLTGEGLDRFNRRSINIDGSMRGFELFSATTRNAEDVAFLFVNTTGSPDLFERVALSLEREVLD